MPGGRACARLQGFVALQSCGAPAARCLFPPIFLSPFRIPIMRKFSRIERLPPYVFNITGELKMAARRRGEDIIDMSMGNPDGATPQHIVDKLVEASTRPDTHGYSVSKGIPRLRKAICDWYMRRYAVEFDPDSEAIVTIGSKEGLAHLMLATLDRGDTVLVPNPSYPIHIYGAVIAGANIRSVRMTPGIDFFEELERAVRESIPKPKMMILGFPSNPTAQCVDLSFFERVVALAKEHDILVVHDLAYADVCFDGYVAPSIMQVPGARDVAVEFFTMSKSYNMAGWRIGYMVGNRELVGALARIKSYHDYGTFTPIQVASIAALDGPQDCVNEIVAQYQRRRDVLARGLHEAGWNVEIPKASMYIWAQIPEPYRAMGSLEFAKRVLSDAKVAVSPGIGFGEYGDEYVRFALIENEQRTRQAVRGIKDMFRKDGLLK
ncbi:aminotransferase [Bordetella bronchiseptica E014]|nr:alanine transaminase [Bordetella bronchiseptica]KCV29134.1 aminotransferase [Bordetella bronchiseptica 00-P-2730]KCV43906.1 aminotransferase [Bordetella bronchiseptica 345]KDC21858.1 aminotransferase [Bordetella bronchiseptica E014]KDC33643.1 aminotransferase [Bordetella bronchiseptica F4563]KDC36618.1 aminotransferase [Bordetella bronchiseptica GA96-01]KDC96002.1 aminotransferase [Bordetella bronchiseptica MBORD675]KDD95325.1 aminotransferase [Bordetella bronchiseptica MO275]KDE00764.1 